MAILHLENVQKKYKNHEVINGINLTIDQPGIWALVGPNGVGKTTLLNCICNVVPINSGHIELLGESNRNYEVFKKVSYLQDNSILFHYLTGYDHLKYVSDIHRLPKGRIQEVVQYLGMDSYIEKKVGAYSLGMKQHLLVALAIINRPKLLFMDEPLNGLDPSSAILIRKILLELVEQDTTIILSSHNLAEIDRVTNDILFLKDGKIIEVNRNDHMETYYIFKLSNPNLGVNKLLEKGYKVEQKTDKIIVQLREKDLNECIYHIQKNGISILDIQKTTTGSEKLYEEYFEK